MFNEPFLFNTNVLDDSQSIDFDFIFPFEEPKVNPESEAEKSKTEKEDKRESFINRYHDSTSTNFSNKKKKINKKEKKPHNRLSSDNLLRKIQVHYFSFLISFLNFLLKYYNYEYKFLKLDYSIKPNINKDAKKKSWEVGNENKKIINSLDDATVETIISQNISRQYKQYKENQNQFICEAVKQNKVLNNILKDNHLNIFKKFYFTSNKIINLKEYGSDNKFIKLPKNIKTHIDLLKKNEVFGEEYRKSINESILKNYFPKAKFLFY